MARRKDFRKANNYTGQKLKGVIEFAYKIDGVRILSRKGELVTRNDLVPPGLSIALTDDAQQKIHSYGDCEVYLGSFHLSNSPLQRHEPEEDSIEAVHIYPLDFMDPITGDLHSYDQRLFCCFLTDPTPDDVQVLLDQALALGYEGLVARTDKRWYRVKPNSTADVYITGYFEQIDKAGKYKGQLGGFTTNWGRVTAFSDKLRKELWVNPEQHVGKLMEVTYKERYHTGMFRYCVTFEHFRTDKSVESFDTEPPTK